VLAQELDGAIDQSFPIRSSRLEANQIGNRTLGSVCGPASNRNTSVGKGTD
jgi:hypothetical protein